MPKITPEALRKVDASQLQTVEKLLTKESREVILNANELSILAGVSVETLIILTFSLGYGVAKNEKEE